jgi:hypothetical protein
MLFVEAKFKVAFTENNIYDPTNQPAEKHQNQPTILQTEVKSEQ